MAYAKLTTLKLVDLTHLGTKVDFSGEVFDLFSYFKKDNEPRYFVSIIQKGGHSK